MQLDLLSDDILTIELLPRIDLKSLQQISILSSRFYRLFNENIHWKHRIKQEFPRQISNKFGLDLKNYYRFLKISPRLPIYYHGDIITCCPFDQTKLDYSLAVIRSYQPFHNTKIILLGQSNIPIIIVDDPPIIFSFEHSVNKIILIDMELFDQNIMLHELIISELCSPLSSLPIYGMFIFGPDEREIIIFDRRTKAELSGVRWSRLSSFQKTDILNLFGASLLDSPYKNEMTIEHALLKIGHLN